MSLTSTSGFHPLGTSTISRSTHHYSLLFRLIPLKSLFYFRWNTLLTLLEGGSSSRRGPRRRRRWSVVGVHKGLLSPSIFGPVFDVVVLWVPPSDPDLRWRFPLSTSRTYHDLTTNRLKRETVIPRTSLVSIYWRSYLTYVEVLDSRKHYWRTGRLSPFVTNVCVPFLSQKWRTLNVITYIKMIMSVWDCKCSRLSNWFQST